MFSFVNLVIERVVAHFVDGHERTSRLLRGQHNSDAGLDAVVAPQPLPNRARQRIHVALAHVRYAYPRRVRLRACI